MPEQKSAEGRCAAYAIPFQASVFGELTSHVWQACKEGCVAAMPLAVKAMPSIAISLPDVLTGTHWL